MIVRVEQENVIPSTQSTSASDPCMVLRGGAIPATLQTFPGMEHDRGLFNGMSQDTTNNGISQILGDSNSFDDEREIEAAAAASEAQMMVQSPFNVSAVIETLPTPHVPPVVIPTVSPLLSSNQTLSPLHINIGESTKCSETNSILSNGSKDKEVPSNGFQAQKVPFQPPLRNTRDYPSQRPSTSTAPPPPPIIMGPPTNSNAPVLLSPAGNLHNGFHRMSSGDSAPSSPSFGGRSKPKGSQFTHSQRPLPPSRLTSNPLPSSGPASNRSSSSTTSPQHGRKEHEMTRRRALVDRIAKSRGSEFNHLLPQVEGLTTTQTSILLRKHRGTLAANGMPLSMQQLIECGAESNKAEEEFVRKIKEANQKRAKPHDFEDLTDLSDLEEDFECYNSQESSKEKDVPRWAPKRIRFSGMLSRTEVLLAEKNALIGMLRDQKTVMDASCGVRFKNEEEVVRRRRQLNGSYYLYRKQPPFQRTTSEPFGCARAMPIQSWSKRKPHRNVFDDKKDDRAQSSNTGVLKPSVNPGEKWIATAQYNIVSYLTEKKEIRETVEYDYEEFRVGEGLQQVDELSSVDPLDFITTPDFTPMEDRQMEYMYRLSTAPSCTIRKKHGRAIYFETDDRKHSSERTEDSKKKTDKKKERKRVDDASSDEESWTASKTPSKKRSRGRPAATPGRKKNSRSSVFVKLENEGYQDYLFDYAMTEEFNPTHLPPALTYANIHVPEWYVISDDFWEDVQDPAPGEVFEDLLVTVAKGHHHIMHTENNRIKREAEKRNRNKQSAMKSAASTPSQTNTETKDAAPPFDMHLFDPHYDASRRRFPSVVPPFVQRDFLSTSPPAESSS